MRKKILSSVLSLAFCGMLFFNLSIGTSQAKGNVESEVLEFIEYNGAEAQGGNDTQRKGRIFDSSDYGCDRFGKDCQKIGMIDM